MKLTDTAWEHFYNWYEKNVHISGFGKTRNLVILHFIAQSETCQNALIIEFFDSVGVYVNTLKYEGKWKFIVNMQYRQMCDSRNEATNAAIKKANEIFNLNNK